MSSGGDISARDQAFMELALKEAAKGYGRTSPNPMVGCVVVDDDKVIAKGHHAKAGEEHAEVVALGKAGKAAEHAELYVSLEPCSHYGRTPPCVDAIKRSGIRRVVAAMIDPDPRVSGRGMRILEEAGIETKVGVCEQQARSLNEGFITRITQKRPFITVKLAMSLDGAIATSTGDSQWISGEPSRELVHQLRARSNVITVGPGTASTDNPRLTARPQGCPATPTPHRFIVEGRRRLDAHAHVFTTDDAQTTLFTDDSPSSERSNQLKQRGVRVMSVSDNHDPLGVRAVVQQAYDDGALTLLVEGGSEYAGAFFDAELVDRLVLFISPQVIGGRDAVHAVGGRGAQMVAEAHKAASMSSKKVGEDLCLEVDFREV